MDIQNMYDSLLQEVYRDILQKERFAGKRGNFVQTENGLVRSVRFASWHEKDDTITFRISVEVRFEKEALLRRESKIAGQGCYREYFPKMPGWSGQGGRWHFGEEDFHIANCYKIRRQADMEAIKDTMKTLLEDVLHRTKQFQTQEDLAVFVNAEYKRNADKLLRQNRAQTKKICLALGVISFLCIAAGRQLIMPALMILTAMYCMAVTIADTKSQRWLHRMILFPIAELLVLTLLLVLISAKVLAVGAAVKGVCIVLFGSGLVSLIIQIMILFMKGYNKRQERKIRWLR
ncbi:MAG: hypothetical protein K2I96_10825 [Lachnospiraceae bacterium]|nr:hypothetical protein [Lachnospiraceae bacterium]